MKNLIKAVKAEIEKRYTVEAEDFTTRDGEGEPRAYRLLNRAWNAKPYKGTPEQVEAKIRRGIERNKAAALAREMAKIEAAAAAPDKLPRTLIIQVEWTNNRTWGATAKGRDNYGNVSDVASGCGYCKQSTATAGVLNCHLPILKKMYLAKDAALAADPDVNNEKALRYGAGYGGLPYFAGGVGVSCHVGILEKLGYAVEWSGDVIVVSEK